MAAAPRVIAWPCGAPPQPPSAGRSGDLPGSGLAEGVFWPGSGAQSHRGLRALPAGRGLGRGSHRHRDIDGTTHALTGAMIGSGLLAAGSEVALRTLGRSFLVPLLLSPMLGSMLAAA